MFEFNSTQPDFWSLPPDMRGHVDAVAAVIDPEAFTPAVDMIFSLAAEAGGPTSESMMWTPRVMKARHTSMQAVSTLMDRLQLEPYANYLEAPVEILDRYDGMLSAYAPVPQCIPDPGTEFPHLRWMLGELRTPMGPFKASRWLGFIQGVMIMNGLLTVPTERDFTRPFLTAKLKPAT